MAEGGAAVVIPDAELDAERLSRAAGELLGDPERLDRMGSAARSLSRPDAAERIADGLLRM
jgi:UDP-N-acetylglucosamine--N-acetylmuramyl-(pentapeptide) pyrophosphoryl-undecaprenol N-acetylglucosamine transferase